MSYPELPRLSSNISRVVPCFGRPCTTIVRQAFRNEQGTVSTQAWALLALTLLAGAASPGPSLALVIRTALTQGRSAAVVVALAHGFGVWLYAVGVVFGIALVLLQSDGIMQMLQVIGALFLGYLGLKMLGNGLDPDPHHTGSESLQRTLPENVTPSWSNARDGFLIVFLNPKIALFFLAIFSQFLAPTQSIGTKLIAASLAGVNDALWYLLIALMVSSERIAARLQRHTGRIDLFFGLLLCSVAIYILWGLIVTFLTVAS